METGTDDIRASLDNLSPERRALLAQRLKLKRSESSKEGATIKSQDDLTGATNANQYGRPAPRIVPRSRDAEIPLCYAQQRLWFLDQMDPGKTTYNIITAVRLLGPLNVAALEKSFNEVVRRHETLRTKFASVGGRPVQVILPAPTNALGVADLGGLSEEEKRQEGMRITTEEIQRPFDLSEGYLFRARLMRLGDEEHALVFTMHHIISDGWSMGVLIREMMALYKAFSRDFPSPLPELPIQYSDYVLWQNEWLEGEVLESQLAYWKQQLKGAPPAIDLPTDRPRPPVQTFNGARSPITLSKSLTDSLKLMGRREGASLFMILLAAFKTLLYRYSGQSDIVIGTPIANRHRSEVEGLIGFFANTLALRTDLSVNPSFKDVLNKVRKVALGAYANQDLPFERLVGELNPERQMSRQPLFQVMFVFQNTPSPALETAELTLAPFAAEVSTAKFDLTLSMEESNGVITGSFEYNTDLFDASTILRMLDHYKLLLNEAAADPDRGILNLPILSDSEKDKLLFEWNDTAKLYGPERAAHEIFESQVRATPEAVSAICNGVEISYADLNGRANQLARYLEKLGVGLETRVAICVERSFDMLAAVLAVLKAGGAYVPLDPAYPQDRLVYMMKDSQALLLLTERRLLDSLPEERPQAICLDEEWDAISNESAANTDSRIDADTLCYVIYTSGSTGRPKGVAMNHGALVNLIQWQHSELRLKPKSKTLQFSSLSFDASFNEMFSTWRSGGALVLIPEDARRDPAKLLRLMAMHQVERALPPYAAFQQLAELGGDMIDSSFKLREILSTAEQLHITPAIRKMLGNMEGCVIHNEYGPSETHVITACTLKDSPAEWPALPPIGRPISNTQIYLLDSQMNPVPTGVFGELYVGGASLARGYLNRPDMTAERFQPDPYSAEPGQRLYKTGDLARYLQDGNIEYKGRLDHQVKIRGFRIELGEVESVLGEHPAIADLAVIVREDEPGQKRLVAYLVAHEKPAPPVSELRGFLQERLPDYMIPSAFVELDALPLSANGKVDRRALPLPLIRPELNAGFLAPTTAAEEVVAKIWAKILKLDRVGIRDNFFELGGHSLLVTQVVSRLRDAFQVELPIRTLFETPTVEGLINAVAKVWGGMEIVEEIAETVKEIDELSADEVKSLLAAS